MQPATQATPVKENLNQQTVDVTLDLFGYEFNIMALAMIFTAIGILFLFWRIQSSNKLDFADMITKDGKAISLTKILQLVGGITATWIMVKLTLTGGLTEAVLGIYLAYVGGIEGYSKFVSAKYKYNETSVRDHVDGEYEEQRRPIGNYQAPPHQQGYSYNYRGARDMQKAPQEEKQIDEDDPSLKPPKV